MTVVGTRNELVDVLDDAGKVTGTATRAEVRAANLLHRSVFVVVVSSAGELLVHRRAEWKDVWPGAWDVAFGGIVEAGEDWQRAAARELREEAGIEAELVYLGEGTYRDDTVRELARVYQTQHDGPIDLVDGEVVEVAWLPLAELPAWLDDRTVCPDSRALVVPRLDAP